MRCSPRRLATGSASWSPNSSRSGIVYKHSRPEHPQTCGKVERFHQTLKKYLAAQRRPRSLVALQAQLDEFVAYYNEVRPHRSLARRTPLEAFGARKKARPRRKPFVVPPHCRIRQDKVNAGKVTLRYEPASTTSASGAGMTAERLDLGGRSGRAGPHT